MNVRKLSRLGFLVVTALVLTMTPRAFADPIDPTDLLFPGGTITVDPSDYALTIPPSDAVSEVGTTIAISGPRDTTTGVEDEGAFDLTPCVSGLSEKRAINYFAATTAECNALDRMETTASVTFIRRPVAYATSQTCTKDGSAMRGSSGSARPGSAWSEARSSRGRGDR